MIIVLKIIAFLLYTEIYFNLIQNKVDPAIVKFCQNHDKFRVALRLQGISESDFATGLSFGYTIFYGIILLIGEHFFVL